MTDVASLVLGVIAAWKACVQVFDVVGSGKQYGMDYEILRVKLEVERIRLLAWGDAAGLDKVENGLSSPDSRLNREEIRSTVLRVLGCIQHIFTNSERLQERYGLRQEQANALGSVDNERLPNHTQFILGSVFKQAYVGLRRSARDRQRSTSFKQKTIWVVHDKVKFQLMVTEIRGFNDNLLSLFPDL